MWRNHSNQTSEADALRELRETFSAAVKWGITTIQDMENDMPPDRCIALLEKMPVQIRVRVIRMPGTTPAGRDKQEGRPAPRSSNPLITVSGTKWVLDGTPLEGTFAPRNDPATMEYFVLHEQLTFPQTELAAMLRESLHDHDQLLLHVSAYPPAAAMLNAMQADGGAQVWAKAASPVRAWRRPDTGFDSTGEGDGNRCGTEPDYIWPVSMRFQLLVSFLKS